MQESLYLNILFCKHVYPVEKQILLKSHPHGLLMTLRGWGGGGGEFPCYNNYYFLFMCGVPVRASAVVNCAVPIQSVRTWLGRT